MSLDISGRTHIDVHLTCEVGDCDETIWKERELSDHYGPGTWRAYPDGKVEGILDECRDKGWEKQDDGRWFCPTHAEMEFVDEWTVDMFEQEGAIHDE